jgi:hypothetical protein
MKLFAAMKLFMGVIVVAMGCVTLQHTPLAFFQILGGAWLTYRGVQEEIAKTRKGKP